MGRLIIAEKHSVAQAIAAALGGGKAEDGWIGCGADAVTWAQWIGYNVLDSPMRDE